ncbi:MAG: hypothetical protein SNJ74_12075 [Fimbriimonadaceae bacterium]
MGPVCHVVPAVPPVFDGLGDYARQLYRHWPEPKPEWHTAAMRVPDDAAAAWPGSIPHRFGPDIASLGAVLDETGARQVALHYVGYGYHPRGIPMALPGVLAGWKRRTGGTVVTFFHELWATGRPTSIAYWTRPAAIWAVLRLMRLSDDWATSCHRYIRILKGLEKRSGVGKRIPIGPNIKPLVPPNLEPWPLDEGKRLRIVVFGSGRTRILALRDHVRLLAYWQKAGQIESVHLVGRSPRGDEAAETKALLEAVGPVEVRESFDLDERQASLALASGNAAVIHNRISILHKSTAYACSMCHGLWCVVPDDPDMAAPADAPVIVARPDGSIADGEPARAAPFRQTEIDALAWESIVAEWARLGR